MTYLNHLRSNHYVPPLYADFYYIYNLLQLKKIANKLEI